MTMRYWGPIRALGGGAILALLVALIFPSIRDTVFDESVREEVFLQAIPFFGAFVCVLLLYILLITLVVRRYNGRIPVRTYNPIESLFIIGIIVGVTMLFNPFSFVFYKYAFVVSLFSLLGFILWSHMGARNPRTTAELPKFTIVHHGAGLVIALLVAAFVATNLITANRPQEPYGERQRLWNTFSEERKAEIRAAAESDFNTVEMPFILLYSLFPAAFFYFGVREVAASAISQGSTKKNADAARIGAASPS